MRKVKPARKLGRTAAHRKATLDNLSTQLLLHKRIETTEAKAKETRKVVEKIITKARKGTVHAQREIFKSIRDKEAIKMLFEEIVSRIGDRNGGYTRIVKLAPRFGDAAKSSIETGSDRKAGSRKTSQGIEESRGNVSGGFIGRVIFLSVPA